MFKGKAILLACAVSLLLGAVPNLSHADGEYVIVAMIQQQNGYICRHMPQAEWDAHVANNTLPAGKYYNVSATLQQLNDLHIWGMHATLEEVEQVFQTNNLAWPCRYEGPRLD
ncbi:MAG: hypothetical protein MUF78_07470 [Candidatus Edwardsbacteria bacterium]|jgi:hypothetical protein|nr:hypothetical protein [Candidatus Edwardsbacteria bacterium]